MPAIDLAYEIREVLADAANEIAELSSPDNEVCRRLRELLRQLTPCSVTVGELAKRIDVAPRDVLDAAIEVGVLPFWHDGQQFRKVAYLETYLRLEYPYDPIREIQFDLMPDKAQCLAEKLSVTPEELLTDPEELSGKSAPIPRKFVASETQLPEQATAGKRREQMG